jgi:hypothetical protein
VVVSLPKGSAAGPSGWTFELITAAINGRPTGPVAALLVEMAQQAVAGTLCCRNLLTASRLIGLLKPDGGVRPIAIGEALYRLIGRLVLVADPVMASGNAAPYVGVHQFGVAYPGGVEAPVHAIRELHDSNRLRALVSLDWRNAFNSIDRVYMAHEINKRAPGLARLYAWSYRDDSLLILSYAFVEADLIASILSQSGVRQGDVLGPLFFSIGVATTMERLAALPSTHPWAYLDDILSAIAHSLTDEATRALIMLILSTAEDEGQKAGLTLNRAKSIIWAADADALRPAYADGNASDYGVATTGLKILGAPVGDRDFVDKSLELVVARASSALDRVAEAALPLQHKLLLLRQCVAQIPTFWTRAVPDSGPALAHWDAALRRRTGLLLGVEIAEGSHQETIARLPIRLGGLGLRSASESAPRAFAASVLFSAALAGERDVTFPCSEATAARLTAVLPELARTNACNDADTWERALSRSEFPLLDARQATGLQRDMQGRADTRTATRLRASIPTRLRSVFDDATAPGSGAWLTAIPADPTLVIPDGELSEVVRAKLLFTAANAALTCPACRATAIDQSHAWTCVSLSIMRTARHDTVVRRLESACRRERPIREFTLEAAPTGTTRGPRPTGSGSSAPSGNGVSTLHVDDDNGVIDDDGIDGEFSVSTSPFLADDLADGAVESGPGIEADHYIGDDGVEVGEGTADDGDVDDDDPEGEPDDDSRQPASAPAAAPRPHRSRGGLALSRPELHADLWLPATSTAVDVMVAAACRHGSMKALEWALARKISKYGPALRDRTIAVLVPFIVSPFGLLSQPARDFLKLALGGDDTPLAKLAKERQHITVATVWGTARLSHTWGVCIVLILGNM